MTHLAWHDLQWCLRRAPVAVLKLLQAHPGEVFVGGGYIRAAVATEPMNDIDLFVPSKDKGEQFIKELAGEHPYHTTDNAFTFFHAKMPVQIIHRWTFAAPEDMLKSFDFTIAMAGFWFDGSKWSSMCHERFYADLAAKRLIYTSPQRNEDAGGSMLRVLKFYQRGYRIPLDCLGAVMARLVSGVRMEQIKDQADMARVLTGLLREVDPNIDPSHIAHLPAEESREEEVQA
jgi:hypothetical protein